jgi:DNA invertase Pin-like site-specific DNA recombinase
MSTAALIGYARTSTIEQVAGFEDQQAKLKAASCTKLFMEQQSGSSKAERKELDAAIGYAREGDTFVVTKADRLARNTIDLLHIVKSLEAKGVALRILDFGGDTLDTKGPSGKLILTLFAAFAEFERDMMLERQRAGIAKAKAEGKFKGRAPTARRKSGEIEAMHIAGRKPGEIAEALGIGRASVFRVLKVIRGHVSQSDGT